MSFELMTIELYIFSMMQTDRATTSSPITNR
jgi:hypothetical protein